MSTILQQHRKRQERDRLVARYVTAFLVVMVLVAFDAPTWGWLATGFILTEAGR